MTPENKQLDTQLKQAGLLSVKELMAGQPLDGFIQNSNVRDLRTFSAWLDSRTEEMLRTKARMDLGKREGNELYEWVLSHVAVLNEVRINFNAAISSESKKT